MHTVNLSPISWVMTISVVAQGDPDHLRSLSDIQHTHTRARAHTHTHTHTHTMRINIRCLTGIVVSSQITGKHLRLTIISFEDSKSTLRFGTINLYWRRTTSELKRRYSSLQLQVINFTWTLGHSISLQFKVILVFIFYSYDDVGSSNISYRTFWNVKYCLCE